MDALRAEVAELRDVVERLATRVDAGEQNLQHKIGALLFPAAPTNNWTWQNTWSEAAADERE